MKLFGFWRKKTSDDDSRIAKLIDSLVIILKAQLVPVPKDAGIKDNQGNLKRKAAGYVYGFIDAALRTIGKDMGDPAVGVPVAYHVFRHLFPGEENEIMEFLIKHIGKDEMVMLGCMRGGQQFLDFIKSGSQSYPMGLGRLLLETEGESNA
jgi:hypothetical protein